nr:hypothetical protein [Tanacetum cinerariifolium]
GPILKTFITGLENPLSLKVKVIRSDNGTKFKNSDLNQFWEEANQQYMLFPMWSTGSSNPQNKEGDATLNDKEHDTEKPESTVNLSPRSSALLREQDEMTKKKDK